MINESLQALLGPTKNYRRIVDEKNSLTARLDAANAFLSKVAAADGSDTALPKKIGEARDTVEYATIRLRTIQQDMDRALAELKPALHAADGQLDLWCRTKSRIIEEAFYKKIASSFPGGIEEARRCVDTDKVPGVGNIRGYLWHFLDHTVITHDNALDAVARFSSHADRVMNELDLMAPGSVEDYLAAQPKPPKRRAQVLDYDTVETPWEIVAEVTTKPGITTEGKFQKFGSKINLTRRGFRAISKHVRWVSGPEEENPSL